MIEMCCSLAVETTVGERWTLREKYTIICYCLNHYFTHINTHTSPTPPPLTSMSSSLVDVFNLSMLTWGCCNWAAIFLRGGRWLLSAEARTLIETESARKEESRAADDAPQIKRLWL